MALSKLENDKLKGVSSAEIRKNIKERVIQWLTELPSINDDTKNKLIQNHSERIAKLKTTAGSESPRYVLFWTNEQLLSLFAKSLSNDATLNDMLPLPPSSTMILEFTLEKNDLMVNGYIND